MSKKRRNYLVDFKAKEALTAVGLMLIRAIVDDGLQKVFGVGVGVGAGNEI